MNQVVILAGGKATRLYPLTYEVPKSLLDICGKPFIDWQLDLLSKSGITSIVLCLGNKGELIEEHVGNGAKYGIDIAYSYDGQSLLGTGGAIINALALLEDQFGILYGDSYLPLDYLDVMRFFEKSGKQAAMTIYKNLDNFDKSNVVYENQVIKEYSKESHTTNMQHIDYGFSVTRKETFEGLPRSVSIDLANIFENLVSEGEVAGYEVDQRFYEVGSFEGISTFKKYVEDINDNIH